MGGWGLDWPFSKEGLVAGSCKRGDEPLGCTKCE
jgi:hypothetical protein